MNRRDFLKSSGIAVGSLFFWGRFLGKTKEEPLLASVCEIDMALLSSAPLQHQYIHDEVEFHIKGLKSIAATKNYKVNTIKKIGLGEVLKKDADGKLYVAWCTLIEFYGEKLT